MNMRCLSVLIAFAAFVTTTTAEADVIKVSPGESIQAAIDMASPGDTILVEPGIYDMEPGRTVGDTETTVVGLHITTDNLRLIGKIRPGQGEVGKVILRPNPSADMEMETGIYAAPDGCGPEVLGECLDEEDEPVPDLRGFYIRGFTVEGFPKNGIQTRFADGFTMIRNESAKNANNGIYPTISSNGLVQDNVSYGSGDTAMWVAACENVRVVGNDVSQSVIGLEVNVSVNVEVKHNSVHDNTVGIALFHPNSAGNKPLPGCCETFDLEDWTPGFDVPEGNWVVSHNDVYDNNAFCIPGEEECEDLPNPAPEGSFQGALPPGVGILLLGVSGNTVVKNDVNDNDFVGIGVLGWCTATAGFGRFSCERKPPVIDGVYYDPSVNDNRVAQNKVSGNGLNPPPIEISFLAADITYGSAGVEAGEFTSGNNCFTKNKPAGFDFFSLEPDGLLPTDGC